MGDRYAGSIGRFVSGLSLHNPLTGCGVSYLFACTFWYVREGSSGIDTQSVSFISGAGDRVIDDLVVVPDVRNTGLVRVAVGEFVVADLVVHNLHIRLVG